MKKLMLFCFVVFCRSHQINAQNLEAVQLPQLQTEIGKPLMQALKLKTSQRIILTQTVGYPK